MRIIDHDNAAVGFDDLIYDARQSCDEVKVKFALQAFLNDLHMQHAQKSAAEAERSRAFRLEGQGCVVELKLFQRIAQIWVLAAVLGVYAAIDHRARRAIAGQSLCAGIGRCRYRVAHLGVGNVFDGSGEVSDVAGRKLRARLKADRTHVANLENAVFCAGRVQQHFGALGDAAVKNAHENDNAAVAVILTVEDKRLERRIYVARRRRNICDDILENGFDVYAVFRAYLRRVHGEDADDILDLVLYALRIGGREVNLVYNGQYLKLGIEREISVGKRLRLNTLRSVNDQHRALAGCQ